MSTEEVFISSIAAIGAHGHDNDVLAAALRAGVPLAQRLDEPAPSFNRRSCTEAALCPKFDLSPWVPPRVARRMSQASQWIVAAGRMALAQAEWSSESGESGDDLAVCFASGFGPSDFVEKLLMQILREGPTAASPFCFTDCVANAPAGQLAIAAKARGANFTISQREAGPVLALIQGAREIRAGRSAAALVGSFDSLSEAQLAILDRLRALAPDAQNARPFDRRRCGFLPGEGVSALVLESAEHAGSRGSQPLARVRTAVRAFDPTASRVSWGTGHADLAEALRAGLARDGIGLASIDAVISGASGARAGDRLEGQVLRELFGDAVPPILVPKAVVGEYGAGGTLVPGVLALRGGAFMAPATFAEPDPEVSVAPASVDLVEPRRVLLSALGSGGAAAFVVLERV